MGNGNCSGTGPSSAGDTDLSCVGGLSSCMQEREVYLGSQISNNASNTMLNRKQNMLCCSGFANGTSSSQRLEEGEVRNNITPIRPGLFGQHTFVMNGNHTNFNNAKDYPTFGHESYGASGSPLRKKYLSAENSKDLTFSNDSKNLIENYERVIKLQAVIRGWLVRKKRNLSVVPPEMNLKSGITTQRTSHRRINSNGTMAEYKSMQELMQFVIEKLVSVNPEEFSQLVHRPFLYPKVL